MIKEELILDNPGTIEVSDLILKGEYTCTEHSKIFERKNNNPFVICLISGALTLAPIGHSSAQIKDVIEKAQDDDFKFVQESYRQSIDLPISNYLDQVNQITREVLVNKIDIVKRILSFRLLVNNWDGFGSIPAEVNCAACAISLIDLIGESQFSKVSNLYPNPHGTISFEWKNSADENISLEVGDELMSYFVELSNSDPIFYDNKPINVEEASKISEFIKLL